MNANNIIVINKYVGTILFIFSVSVFQIFLVDIRSEAWLNLFWKSIQNYFQSSLPVSSVALLDICLGCELKAHHL
jgi:hypothetical protein